MKQTNRKLKIAALISLFVGSLGLVGFKHGSPEMRVEFFGNKIAEKLNFNSEQRNLLAEITTELKADIAEEKARRLSLRNEIEKLILAPELDQARVKQLVKEKQARMDAKVDKYVTKVAALHKSLTPEQRKDLINKVQRFTEMRDHDYSQSKESAVR